MRKPDEWRSAVEAALKKEPALHAAASNLLSVMRVEFEEDSPAAEIVGAIESNTALTRKFMRVANSRRFGVGRRTTSVGEVVADLGHRQTKNLCASILSAELIGAESRCPGFDRLALWRHAVGTAATARSVQRCLAPEDEDPALYPAGLLCNIGRIVLDSFFAKELGGVLALAHKKKCPLMAAEREVLGVAHPDVSAWAVALWGGDESLVRLIAHHHGPLETKSDNIINLAYVLVQAKRIGTVGGSILEALQPGVLSALGVADDKPLDDLLRTLTRTYRYLETVFLAMGRSKREHLND